LTMSNAREDRINQLVAVCVHNNKNPTNTAGFADFIIKVCNSVFGCNRQTAKEYVRTLVSNFRLDKWCSIVQKSTYLNENERSMWLHEHS
jgi:hypothetical protein